MTATVTPIRPAIPASRPTYRVHHTRPTTAGPDLTEWGIEATMALAVDLDSTDPLAVLTAFHPHFDVVLVESIERLYTLAEQAGHAEVIGDWRMHEIAAAEYRDELTQLARALRSGS